MAASGRELEAILATIREQEGGSYTDPPNGPNQTASGAYQFTDGTWISAGGGRYARAAYLATPEQQDEIAGIKVNQILAAHGGDFRAIPQIWYLGHIATQAELDRVPAGGNRLTPRQYVEEWMGKFLRKVPGIGTFADDATSAAQDAAKAVLSGLGNLAEPFVEGLRRLSIIGLAVTLGLGLVGMGAWRSVKGTGG